METTNIFYTYIYLDPRKKGSFIYGTFVFTYDPFYVGKGKGNQYLSHLKEGKNNNTNHTPSNKYKNSKIKKILKENLEPIILKVEYNISEKEAFDLEIWLIWAIGRNDLKLGPLTNHTNGGEGISGYNITKENKKILSQKAKIQWKNQIFKTKEIQRRKIYCNISKNKEKLKYASNCRTKETFSIISKKLSIHYNDPKNKIKMSNIKKKYYKDNPDKKEEHSNKLKEFYKNNPEYKILQADKHSKKYLITYPDGHNETIKNLKLFCNLNNLSQAAMGFVANNKQKSHKSFKVQKIL
jgi:hypothetical protein